MKTPAHAELTGLFAIVALALCLRVAAIVLFEHVAEGDELACQSMASGLIEGRGIVDHLGNRPMHSVGCPPFFPAPLFGRPPAPSTA